MSRFEFQSASTSRVIEQGNLLGGADVVTLVGRGRRQRRRAVQVESDRVGFAAALALVVEHGRRARQAAEVPPRTRCPHCGRMGLTEEDFGTRIIAGKRRPQSWCRTCRAEHAARAGCREGQESWRF